MLIHFKSETFYQKENLWFCFGYNILFSLNDDGRSFMDSKGIDIYKMGIFDVCLELLNYMITLWSDRME